MLFASRACGRLRRGATRLNHGTVTALGDASDRILAVVATHDHVWRQDVGETFDLAELLPKLCQQLDAQAPSHRIHCDFESAVVTTAPSIALLVTEAVTNAIRYAYPHESGGPIQNKVASKGDQATLTISDNGGSVCLLTSRRRSRRRAA